MLQSEIWQASLGHLLTNFIRTWKRSRKFYKSIA